LRDVSSIFARRLKHICETNCRKSFNGKTNRILRHGFSCDGVASWGLAKMDSLGLARYPNPMAEAKGNLFVADIQAKVTPSPARGFLTKGMPNALLCAEAVAMMVLGKEPPEYFPRSYLLTDERVNSALEDAERSEGRVNVKRVKL